MRIGLLGPTAVWNDALEPVPAGGPKQRAVLAQLAREPNRAVHIDRLAEGTWGEQVPARYRQNLQVYVSQWRRALDHGRPAGTSSRILGHREAYELIAGPEEVDVSQFLADADLGAALLADGRPQEAAVKLADALAQWRGQPLVDLADQPFAGEWMTELEQRRLAVLERRIDADLARGRHTDLTAELELLVAQHPVRERFWQQLVVAQYRNGRQADALDTVARARSMLLEELGLDPGPALKVLEHQVLQQDPVLLALAPVALSAALPVPLSAPVGRDALIGEVATQVTAGARLLVLTGPGGVGKTRVALAVGQILLAAGRGVIWVPLADEVEVSRVVPNIAAAAGFSGPTAELAEALGSRRAVLLLDNVEQLPGIAAPLRDLLEHAPRLQVVVTSRGPVGLPGELVIEIPPLTAEADQVGLFVERARAVDPLFDADSQRADIVRVCRAVDGLPLGIELVAARSRIYHPAELASALGNGGLDLAATPGDTGRHASVANSVRWSVNLLAPADFGLFTGLSLFDGTVDRPTAQALAADPGSLDRLVQVALLRPLETPAGRRFGMLATVRAVAAELLTDDTREATLAQVSRLWVDRSTGLDHGARATARDAAQAGADLSATGLVVRRLLAHGALQEAATVVLALHQPLVRLSRYRELLELAESVLQTGADAANRVRLAAVAAEAADRLFDVRAEALLPQIDELPADDHLWRAKVLYIRTNYQAYRGAAGSARADSVAGLAEAELTGNPTLIANAYGAASFAAVRRGDGRSALDLARAQGDYVTDDVGRCIYLNDLALAALQADDVPEAEHSVDEAIRIGQRISPRKYLEYSWKMMASVRFRQNHAAGAASLLAAALDQFGPEVDEGWALEACAQVGLASVIGGDRVDGIRLMRRSNGYALRIGADNALPDRDEVIAAQNGVPAGSYGRPLPPGTPLPEFVALAREIARENAGSVALGTGDH